MKIFRGHMATSQKVLTCVW